MTERSQTQTASTLASDSSASRRQRRGPLAAYMQDGAALSYEVGSGAIVVAERDGFYTLYAVAVTASDGSGYRHLLIVPTNVGAASFDVGLALLETDSVEADADRFGRVETLASALKWDHRRYRAFPPPPGLNRFCMRRDEGNSAGRRIGPASSDGLQVSSRSRSASEDCHPVHPNRSLWNDGASHGIVPWMNFKLQPSAPASRRERLTTWMRARPWRKWLILYPLAMTITGMLLLLWIAVAYLRGSTEPDAAAVALNLVLVGFVATIGLTILHYGLFRRFQRSSRSVLTAIPPQEPIPSIDWPWGLRLRHAVIYAIGMATLLCTFMPYDNQLAISRFLVEHGAGRQSTGNLTMLFFYLPMIVFSILTAMLVDRKMKQRDAGMLDEREKALLVAETDWLFSFGAAFVSALFFCNLAESMIAAHL